MLYRDFRDQNTVFKISSVMQGRHR